MKLDSKGEKYRRDCITSLESAIKAMNSAIKELEAQKGIGTEMAVTELKDQISKCRKAIKAVEDI